jgi:hypothetical protein
MAGARLDRRARHRLDRRRHDRGSAISTVLIAAVRWLVSPISENSAAPVMKKGNSAISTM